MKIEGWQGYALGAFIVWGLWGFLPKVAMSSINPRSVLIWEGVGSILFMAALILFGGFKLETNAKGMIISIIIGFFGLLAELFYIYAIKGGKVSIVVALTALYPLLTILMSLLFLKESITPKQIVGMIMALGAVILLV